MYLSSFESISCKFANYILITADEHDIGFPVHYSQLYTSLPDKYLLIFSFLNALSVISAYFLLGKRHKTSSNAYWVYEE